MVAASKKRKEPETINCRIFMPTRYWKYMEEGFTVKTGKWIPDFKEADFLRGWVYLFKCFGGKWYLSHEIFGMSEDSEGYDGEERDAATHYQVDWSKKANVENNNVRKLSSQSANDVIGIIKLQHYDINGKPIHYKSVYSPFQLPWNRLPKMTATGSTGNMWEVVDPSGLEKNDSAAAAPTKDRAPDGVIRGKVLKMLDEETSTPPSKRTKDKYGNPYFEWAEEHGANDFIIPDVRNGLKEEDFEEAEFYKSKLVTPNAVVVKYLYDRPTVTPTFPRNKSDSYGVHHYIMNPLDEVDFFQREYTRELKEYEVNAGIAKWEHYEHYYVNKSYQDELKRRIERGLEELQKFEMARFIESTMLDLEERKDNTVDVNGKPDQDAREEATEYFEKYMSALSPKFSKPSASNLEFKHYRTFISDFQRKKKKYEKKLENAAENFGRVLLSKRYCATMADLIEFIKEQPDDSEEDKDWKESLLEELTMLSLGGHEPLGRSRVGREILAWTWEDYESERNHLPISKLFSITRKSFKYVDWYIKIFANHIIPAAKGELAPGEHYAGVKKAVDWLVNIYKGIAKIPAKFEQNKQWQDAIAYFEEFLEDKHKDLLRFKEYRFLSGKIARIGTIDTGVLQGKLKGFKLTANAYCHVLLGFEFLNVAIVVSAYGGKPPEERTLRDTAQLSKSIVDLTKGLMAMSLLPRIEKIYTASPHKTVAAVNATHKAITGQISKVFPNSLAKGLNKKITSSTVKALWSWKLRHGDQSFMMVTHSALKRFADMLSFVGSMLETYIRMEDFIEKTKHGDRDSAAWNLVAASGGAVMASTMLASLMAGGIGLTATLGPVGAIIFGIGLSAALLGTYMGAVTTDDAIEKFMKHTPFGLNAKGSKDTKEFSTIHKQYTYMMENLLHNLNCRFAPVYRYSGAHDPVLEGIELRVESGNLYDFDDIILDVKAKLNSGKEIQLAEPKEKWKPQENEKLLSGERIVRATKRWNREGDLNAIHAGTQIDWEVKIKHYGISENGYERVQRGTKELKGFPSAPFGGKE